MKARILFTIVIAAAAAGLMAAQGTPEDDRIYDLVRVRMAENRDVGGQGRIQVAVKNGEVTLAGTVETEKLKDKAAKVAKKVKGVKSVVNNLKVDK